MRKWITALLIVTMVLTAGCGQKGTDQGAAGGADQGTSQAASGGSQSGPVTINYYGRPDDNQVESTIIQAFEDSHPDI